MFFKKKFSEIEDKISYVYDAYTEVSMKCLRLQKDYDTLKGEYEDLKTQRADAIFAYHELEKRVIALEHFKEDVGTEILEAVEEQKKQEQKITIGMENIFNYHSQGKKDK